MDRTDIAAEGAALVRRFELQLEDTIVTASELTGYFARARREANVSPTFGQKLFDQSAQALSLLVQTRGVSIHLHTSAEAATRMLGIQMGAPNEPKPADVSEPLLTLVPAVEAA